MDQDYEERKSSDITAASSARGSHTRSASPNATSGGVVPGYSALGDPEVLTRLPGGLDLDVGAARHPPSAQRFERFIEKLVDEVFVPAPDVKGALLWLNALDEHERAALIPTLGLGRLRNLLHSASRETAHTYARLIGELNLAARAADPQRYPTHVDQPNRVGLEQELTSFDLRPKAPADFKNGIVIAQTDERELDLPIWKLETEGAKRKSLCMELIHGPLPPDEYGHKKYVRARAALDAALKGQYASLEDMVAAYNELAPEGRYRLTALEAAQRFSGAPGRGKPGAQNTQTNIAIPYSKIGSGSDFAALFESKADGQMFEAAQEAAPALVDAACGTVPKEAQPSDVLHLLSLFTHVVYQEAKYAYHDTQAMLDSAEPDRRDAAKHQFHVMIKASPEDAVFSILSNEEAAVLATWWQSGNGPMQLLVQQVKTALAATGRQPSEAKLGTGRLSNVFGKAVALRVRHGAQLLSPASDKGISTVSPADYTQKDETIAHSHPRPTNRIPIYGHGRERYVVVEQRSGAHPLNDPKVLAAEKRKLIAAQQRL